MKSIPKWRQPEPRNSYNVYLGFKQQNHKPLWSRAVEHPAFLIAVLLVAFAVVGSIDYAVAVAEGAR